MATVSFRGTTRYYAGVDRPAVDALDLEVADGEFLVLVGPSGCGKSTTLRMLAGLEGVDEGQVWIGDRDVTEMPPKARDIAMVFQNYALYPHMTVAENIGFHLKIAGMPKAERDVKVTEAAKLLDLERVPGAQARQAVGRSAPAGGHGPGDRARAAGVPDGRATVQLGRQAARADPHPDRVAATEDGRHHHLRHARPGRGDDDGGQGRRPQGRPAAAVRHPDRPVRQASQPVRRRVHRLARDEPHPGHRARGDRAGRRPAGPAHPWPARGADLGAGRGRCAPRGLDDRRVGRGHVGHHRGRGGTGQRPVPVLLGAGGGRARTRRRPPRSARSRTPSPCAPRACRPGSAASRSG